MFADATIMPHIMRIRLLYSSYFDTMTNFLTMMLVIALFLQLV